MSLRVAVQMDPLEGIDIRGDSSFRIMLEAQTRGHRLWHCAPESLGWVEAGPFTRACPVAVRDEVDDPFDLGVPEERPLGSFDVVFLRQDPPFDMHYVTTTHLLESATSGPLVTNDPFWVRNAPEKLFVTRFADLMPPTLISRDPERIAAFRAEHGDLVVKPLYGNGGEGVFRLRPDDANFNPLLQTLIANWREPLVVQRFLPAVLAEGDRRLILIDGELAGGILRKPPAGEVRSNLHIGGRAEAWEPNARDREVADRVGPLLREKGLLFAGLDIIGEHLTEINVTSPTGIRELERFTGVNAAGLLWDAVESRLARRGAAA